MKRFFFFCLALLVAFDIAAQVPADTVGLAGPHHLLWYKGDWTSGSEFSIQKDNIFKDGGTVTVNPSGKITLQSSAINAWNKKVDQALQQIDAWEEQLNADANNVDLTTHHLNETQLPDVEDMKEEWDNLKVDQQRDILSADANDDSEMNNILATDCEKFKPWYDEIMAFYRAHRRDKDADLHNPDPPQLDYTCYACDSAGRRNDKKIVARYVQKFMSPEDTLIRKGLAIERAFALLGIDQKNGTPEQYDDLFRKNKKDPSQSGPCSYVDLYDLSNAILEIHLHEYRRAVKLLFDNRNNFKAAEAVSEAYLKSARDWALNGGGEDGRNMAELAPIFDKLFDYYYQKLKRSDWTQIGNYPYLFSLLRQEALLGADEKMFFEYIDKMKSIFNNFQLTIEPDVKAGTSEGYTISHLKGKCFIIPEFKPDSDQCYKWVIADDQAVDYLGFRKTKPIQQIDCDVITNEIVGPAPRPVYIGTKHYVTELQRLHMDFCNPGSDTLLLSGFYPNPEDGGVWQFPQNVKQNLNINQTDQFFKSIEDMKRLADSGRAKAAAMKMKAKAEQLKAEMEALQKKMNGSGDKLSNYQQIMELAQKAQSLTSNINVAPILYIDFKLPVKNNSPVLVNNRFDAKQINPELTQALVYGYFTVDIRNLAVGGSSK